MSYSRGRPALKTIPLVAMALLAGCAGQEAATIPEVALGAADYSFNMPDTVAGGLVRIQFSNSGTEEHHAQLIRLNDGVTGAQFDSALQAVIKARATEGDAAFMRLFEIATVAGGPASLGAGGHGAIITRLAPGEYRVVCFVPSPTDGVSHVIKGMIDKFVVTPAGANQPQAPTTVATVDMLDFGYTLPDIPADSAVLRVTNSGKEPHEIAILRLKGITGDQALQMLTAPMTPGTPPPPGPPPFEFVGGYLGMMPGDTAWMVLKLPAGEYAALCFIPSVANQGKAHIALGMFKAFTVD